MDQVGMLSLEMTKDQNDQIDKTVQRERGRLLRFIRERVSNDEEAEDILQDVFYQLVESYRLMKPIEQLTAWLFTVARNKITDRYRKKRPERLDTISVGTEEEGERLFLADLLAGKESDGNDRMMNELLMETLADALDELPIEQREVFIMHELEDKSFKEIAEEKGVTVNTLLSRKRYAVLFLRERLRSIYNEMFNE